MTIPPVNPSASAASAAALLASAGGARKLSALPAADQAKAAAGQFEAIMIRQFLQDSVGGMMGGEEGGPSGSVYGYLLTDVLANKLTEGGGLGLGRMLQRQLTPATPATPPQGPL
jgi:peptidoglycan hydrolase FlgJ